MHLVTVSVCIDSCKASEEATEMLLDHISRHIAFRHTGIINSLPLSTDTQKTMHSLSRQHRDAIMFGRMEEKITSNDAIDSFLRHLPNLPAPAKV